MSISWTYSDRSNSTTPQRVCPTTQPDTPNPETPRTNHPANQSGTLQRDPSPHRKTVRARREGRRRSQYRCVRECFGCRFGVRWLYRGTDTLRAHAMTEPMTSGRGNSRGYSWAPFEPGNEAHSSHGADSPRRWRPIADELAEQILGEAPWLARPAFKAALHAWAAAEARAHLVGVWLDEHGLLDDEGAPRPAATYALRLDQAAASRRAQLGLDPASLAKLLANYAIASGAEDVLAALKAEGAAVLAQRAPQALTTPQTAAEAPQNEGERQ